MGACRRGYSGVFWHVFVRGKCTPGRGSRSVKKLFIDRLEWDGGVVVLDANRRGFVM